MTFTSNCDIFASFHENAFNNILQRVREQRPSLFNYATQAVINTPRMLCSAIKAHPIVTQRGNPLITLQQPLPIIGSNYGLNFAAQITDLALDFHPENKFALPPELAPLDAQHFALHLQLCGGIGCPGEVDQLVPPPAPPHDDKQIDRDSRSQRNTDDDTKVPTLIQALPSRELMCFCLDAYVEGWINIQEFYGKPYLNMHLEGFEIVDIRPEGLEANLECYISLMLKLVVLPGLRVPLEHTVLDLKHYLDNLKKSIFINVKPTPTSAAVPHNPAIERDELQLFINMEVA